VPKSVDAIAATYLRATDQIAVSENCIAIRFPRMQVDGLENATAEQLSHTEITAAVYSFGLASGTRSRTTDRYAKHHPRLA
jgi:hypothetical protein